MTQTPNTSSQKKLARSARQKGKYRAQAVRTRANKLRKCKKHLAKHPNDTFGKAQYLRRLRGEV